VVSGKREKESKSKGSDFPIGSLNMEINGYHLIFRSIFFRNLDLSKLKS